MVEKEASSTSDRQAIYLSQTWVWFDSPLWLEDVQEARKDEESLHVFLEASLAGSLITIQLTRALLKHQNQRFKNSVYNQKNRHGFFFFNGHLEITSAAKNCQKTVWRTESQKTIIVQ